ncbi:MAG: S-adenosylmethionine:tRNA ribosyltransferase-isomerase [Ferruginibacter sp.]|nr:S-adenosylmethionine:tRNA ribosyltransferase-isomerase [Ferruginibacter sp.]
MNPQQISIDDYNYNLPDDRIALHPLAQRDASKLLLYKNAGITETVFSKIDEQLPAETLLVFNNTKVINARVKFTKPTGAVIEVFCLEPFGDITEYSTVMSAVNGVQWKCLIGGAAKWKGEILQKEITIGAEKIILSAKKLEKITEAFIIEFSWMPASFSFAEIIEAAGNVPLPPYIKRTTEEEDTSRYQTIFAEHDGSVAAPTAGLHFTENIFEKLRLKNIQKAFVTLHVGGGTFKPVKAATMQDHEMHSEYIDVDMATIQTLQNNIGKIAVVGTTSLRTVESLYWFGVKVFNDKNLQTLSLHQWDVYADELLHCNCSAQEALGALIKWMKENNKQRIFTQTQILIAPGYTFRIANIIITNFHQPKSTLLLLVAAAIGNDWKKMYDYALENDFRFLSYGDGNLIWL